MKTRNLTRLGALALTMTMVTTSLMGGTLAKYTTEVSGTDTVTLAKFGYEANDGADNVTFTTDGYAAIDLFDDLSTAATGTVQIDTEGNMYLAPGAYGTFQIELDGSASDVDIEMLGSTVTAETTGNADISDMFISYTITYDRDEYTAATIDFTKYQGYATNGTGDGSTTYKMYDVHRVSLEQFAFDLQTVLSSVVLEKNTVGTISVAYAWEEVNSSTVDDNTTGTATATYATHAFDFHGLTDTTSMLYDEADTVLALDWADSSTTPTFTLKIDNVASQVVASTTEQKYTTTKSFIANVNANFDVANQTDKNAYIDAPDHSNYEYKSDNDTTGDATTIVENPNTNYVTFDMNGIEGTLSVTKRAIGEEGKISATATTTTTQTGVKFVEWNTKADGTGDKVTAVNSQFTGNTTVYAIWKYDAVTLDVNNDNNTSASESVVVLGITGMPTDTTVTLNADGTVSSLPTLYSSNYTFDGWFANTSEGSALTTADDLSSYDTIYAKWTVRPISDGGDN